MAECGKSKSSLVHGGTSQRERTIAALNPSSVQIEERTDADWIVFAARLAEKLAFHTPEGQAVQGGWTAFFARDEAAILGKFAIQDVAGFQGQLSSRLAFLRDDAEDDLEDEDELKRTLSEVFAALVTLAVGVQWFRDSLPKAQGFRTRIDSEIQSHLGPALRTMIAYLRGAQDLALLVTVEPAAFEVLSLPVSDAVPSLETVQFSALWLGASGVTSLEAIAAESSIFLGSSTSDELSVFQMVSRAASHFLFHSAVESIVQSYARLVRGAQLALAASLTQSADHQPHYALYLSFLKLFAEVTTELNGLTAKHLDFYYRAVLRLRPKAAKPDRAHIVAELARHKESSSLELGREFLSNKDSERKERLYLVGEETVLNRGSVAQLMAVYRAEDGPIYAAMAINSEDGLGKPLSSELLDFHPFLSAELDPSGAPGPIAMPLARLGFGVSSEHLLLGGGKRTIRLRLRLTAVPPVISAATFRAKLSAQQGWFDAPSVSITPDESNLSPNILVLSIELTAAAPPIVGVDPEVHGTEMPARVPALKLELAHADPASTCYTVLSALRVQSIEVSVDVGSAHNTSLQDGIRLATLLGPHGVLDPTAPFLPWGGQPTSGSPFVFGSAELFSKAGTSFALHIKWSNWSAPSPPVFAMLQFLSNGSWVSQQWVRVCSASSERLWPDLVSIPPEASSSPLAAEALLPTSRGGFGRLLLNGDFGHRSYPADLADVLIRRSLGESSDTARIPDQPYTPTVESLSCVYQSTTGEVDLLATPAQTLRFFHLGPFGAAEQTAAPQSSGAIPLLPQLRIQPRADEDIRPVDQAHFYIGLKDIKPGQAIQLLLQVLEGTTAPLLGKPLDHVRLSYWSHNCWLPLSSAAVRDGTRQLTQTGLLRLQIPKDATQDEGIMPHGKIWLCASVQHSVGAVCRLLGVHAQAFEVHFEDHDNAPDAMNQTLLANTIRKLKRPSSDFKKFTQPYSSFGGKASQSDQDFYRSSSERLRHRARAVTIWDYEHLVLEQFPQVHRVKCLHHTRVLDDPQATL